MAQIIPEIRTTQGTPIVIGDLSLTPESQSVILVAAFPNWHTGLVWNRPVAVLVSRNGEQSRIPIMNLTRIGMVLAAGLGVLAALLLLRVQSLLKMEQ